MSIGAAQIRRTLAGCGPRKMWIPPVWSQFADFSTLISKFRDESARRMPGTAAPTESTQAAGAGCGTAGRAVGGDQLAGAVLLSSLDHPRRVPLMSGHGLLFLSQATHTELKAVDSNKMTPATSVM